MSGLDWAALLRSGLVGTGLHPSEFWALTPFELSVLLGVEGREPPLTRARLMEMDAAFNRREV